MPDFTTALLSSLGARATPENTRFVNAWVRAEGTKAGFNPLATTQTMGPRSNFNSVGVQNYPNFQTGLNATVKTLTNGRYVPIVSGLRSGTATANQLAQAVANSPWGTGRGVLNVLGSSGGGAITPPAALPLPKPPAVPSTSSTLTVPGTPNLAGALLSSMGQGPGAQLNSIMAAVTSAQPQTVNVPGSNASVPAPPHGQPPAMSKTPPGIPASKGAASIISTAREALGTPYVWGGATAGHFDCSGLVQYALGKVGVSVPHGSIAQFHMGQSVPQSQLRPGDAVFLEPGNFPQGYGPGHVGIYIGNNKFIEAPHTGDVVKISQLFGKGGRAESMGYMGARRFA